MLIYNCKEERKPKGESKKGSKENVERIKQNVYMGRP